MCKRKDLFFIKSKESAKTSLGESKSTSFYSISKDLHEDTVMKAWLHLLTTMSEYQVLSFHLSSLPLCTLFWGLCLLRLITSAINVHADLRWLQKMWNSQFSLEDWKYILLCLRPVVPSVLVFPDQHTWEQRQKHGCYSTQHTRQVIPVMHP